MMTNDVLLERLNKELNELTLCSERFKEFKRLFAADMKEKVEDNINNQTIKLKTLIKLLKECEEKGFQLGKKYYLSSSEELCGIYFSINYSEYSHILYGHFYIEDDEWLYENFYSSHSDLNTMINNLIVANLAFNIDYIEKELSNIKDISIISYMHDLLTTSNWKRDFLILTVQNTLNMLKNHYQDGEEVYIANSIDVSSRSKLTIIESTEKTKEETYKEIFDDDYRKEIERKTKLLMELNLKDIQRNK